MVSPQEIELLTGILQRAPVSQIEALFLNSVLERLRIMVTTELMANENESPKTAQSGNDVSV